MKSIIHQSRRFGFSIMVSALALLGQDTLQAEPTIVYLVDPDDVEEQAFWAEEGLMPIQAEDFESGVLRADPRPPLSQTQARIHQNIQAQQARLIALGRQFLELPFDPNDEMANPEFVKVKEGLVDLVFKSPTERDFYSRLYLINQLYLDHLELKDRFDVLDRTLRDEWIQREARRKQIREVIIGGSALLGAAAGAFISFRVSQKVLPITADEKTLGLFFRWLGRAPMILVGAGVGAAAGAYAGFLGSDYLLYRQFEFLDPIDGDEDLVELLELIDQLPR